MIMYSDGYIRIYNAIGAAIWYSPYISGYYTERAQRLVFTVTPYGLAVFDARD